MSSVTIRTNRNWRNFRYRDEVPPAVLAPGGDLDWVDPDEIDGFLCYRGTWYHLSQFLTIPRRMLPRPWNGYHADGFTSGIVIECTGDCEQYRIGTYFG